MIFKLPDFTKCLEFNELFDMMGIESVNIIKLSNIEFVKTVQKNVKRKLSDEETAKFLNAFSKGITIGSADVVSTNKNGLLELNGTTCCIYIKLQRTSYRYGTSSYKYHLFECKTIQEMIAQGRKNRYVATTRHDGFFNVVKQNTYGEPIETEERLGLCLNCQSILRNKGILNNFNLKDFFEKNRNYFSNTYVREETVSVQEQYSPSQAEISQKYKEQTHYKCCICGLDCSNKPHLLHLHHKDGNGQNNVYTNLQVLCVRCHSRKPLHGQMLTRFASEIYECKRMAKKQGIVFKD